MSKQEQPEASTSTNGSETTQGNGKSDIKMLAFFEEPKKSREIVKHAILKSHLDAWFPIMLSNGFGGAAKELVYVDGFAGPGLYAEDEKEVGKTPPEEQLGSPVLVYKALAQHSKVWGKEGKIILIFFEIQEEFYKRLKKNIEQAKMDYPTKHNVKIETQVHHGDFNKLMTGVLQSFPGSAMFVFADPFEHSLKMSTLQKILSTHTPASPRELLLNLMDGILSRFMDDEKKYKRQDELLGVGDPGDPKEKCKESTPDEKLNIISDSYIRRLQEGQANKPFVLKFAMKDAGDQHVSHLVFVTFHIKGLEKMKTNMSNKSQDYKSLVFSEWVAEKNGTSVRDFKSEKKEMAQDILKLLIHKFSLPGQETKVCGIEIHEFILIDTPYPTNVKPQLKKLMKEAGIKFDTKGDFKDKMHTFPKRMNICTRDNQPMQEIHHNRSKNDDDDSVASSSGDEPPSKKPREST